MSIAEQTATTANTPRRIPSTVRLGPEVVNRFYTSSESEDGRAPKHQSAAGLLFGTAEQDVLCVEALKPFSPADSTENGSHKREWLDGAFERSFAAAKADPYLKSLHLVGWYWIRCPDDIVPLFDADIAFHNRRFRRVTDIVLILRPKQDAPGSIELYGRSSSKIAMSKQGYRSGSMLLSNGAHVDTPKNVIMRDTLDDDYYLRVFQILDSLDSAEKTERWRKIALRLKTGLRLKAMMPLSLKPVWKKSRLAPAVQTTDPDSSDLADDAKSNIIPPSFASTGPMVISRIRATGSAQTKLRWMSSAVLLVLAMGIALTWVYARPLLSALPVHALFHRMAGSTPFDMRVESQADGSLLVKWDAHAPAIQSAKDASMRIDDGPEHRSLQLDPNEVATGSILYTPVSKDLTFRLEVFDGKGSPTFDSLRVVNGSKSALPAHIIANPQPSTVAKAPPNHMATARSRQLDTASHARATPPAVVAHTPSDVRSGSAQTAPPPSVNARISPPAKPSPPLVPGSARSETTSSRVMRTATQDLAPKQPLGSSPQPAVRKNSESAKYVPAHPLKQVIPSATNLGLSSGATDVEIDVRIDQEGQVIQAWVGNNRSDNELLARAAIAAAKEWIFEPAKMYGKSVVSDHMIVFHFQPQVGR